MNKLVISCAATAALFTSGVSADESFVRYDANRDGSVDYAELASAKKVKEFDLMDRNRSSSLSAEEYAEGKPEKVGAWDLFATPEFSALDADTDGSVTLAEFGAAIKALIAKIDASEDSKVSSEEYAAAVEKQMAAAAAAGAKKGSAPK